MRITDNEYSQRISALYASMPRVPSREQQRALRRGELELAIDHRLGREFPPERREALWAIQERVERRRGRLMLWYLVRRLVPGILTRRAQHLAGFVVEEYAKVLSQDELVQFFGRDEVGAPSLPIDARQR